MNATRMKYAQLDDAGLQKVQALEQQTGALILVMERVHPLANLNEEQIKKIQALEQELGVILIAYPRSVVTH